MQDVVAGDQVRTFLIADVRGYTRYTLEHGDVAAARLAVRFGEICGDVTEAHGGELIELRGDEALAVFVSTRAALLAASALQERLGGETRANPTTPLRVGIGLDAGEAIPVGGGYRGAALNLAARLCSLAGPGEVLASEAVTHLARRVEGLAYVDRAEVELKGFAEPVRVFAVRTDHGAGTPEVMAEEAEAGAGTPAPLPIGGFLGSLPGAPLAAREDECARLLASVDIVARGEGRLLMLAGEPGVGKTRLVQEVTLHLRNAGFAIAAGSCFETRQTVPYYPMLDVLSALYGAASPATRAQVRSRWTALGHLLPEAGIEPVRAADQQEEQERIFRAVNGFVTALAAEQPVAILLDDLHWADHASLDLLEHLARHTRGTRVLILGTYRDVEVGRQHPLEGALVALGRHGLLERMPVRRLDRRGTTALMEIQFNEEISDELAQLIYEHTEGNPFFTHEVIRALMDRGDIYRKDGRWERLEIDTLQVPESVRAAIGQRLSRLAPATQDALHQASVLGQRFEFELLLAMTGGTEDELDDALQECTAAGLVRVLERDRYAFDHALTQQTLYGEISPRRRRRMHLAAGVALEAETGRGRRGGPPRSALIALHFLQADDDRALPYAVRAGDEAVDVYAHGEAGAQYTIALELAREQGERTLEAEILGKLAATLHDASLFEDAIEPADQAATAYRALSDDEGERRATAVLVRCLTRVGRYDEAAHLLQRLLTDDAPFTRGTLELHQAGSLLLFSRSRYSEFATLALKEREIAQALGDDLSIARAAHDYALGLRIQGRVQESVPPFEAALSLAERVAESSLLGLTLHNLADANLELGHLPRALACWERCVEVARSYGDPATAGFKLAFLGHALTIQGRWNEARAMCEQGLAMFDDIGQSSWFATYPVLFLADLDQYQGRPEFAGRLQDALQMALDLHDEQSLYYLADTVAREAVLRDPTSAWRTMEQISAAVGDLDAPTWLPAFLIHSARVQTEMGEAEGALHTLEACFSSHVLELPRFRIPALRNLGVAQTRLGAFAAAETAFAEALQHARAMPWPFAEATIHVEWGLLERARGREDVAGRRLQEALTLFRSLGAEPYAQLAKDRLSA